MEEVDVFKSLEVREVHCLDHGHVRLIDCYPRIVPLGKTMEHRIADSARQSYAVDASRPFSQDVSLITRLYEDRHTSPFEQLSFTFSIKVPQFVAVHFLRHRTAKVNQQSQRYTEVKDEFYHPSKGGLREQHPVNHQCSKDFEDEAKREEVKRLMLEMENVIDDVILPRYHALLKAGAAREVARSFLPEGIYTTLTWQMDLHNLLHFLRLRCADDCQHETRVFAIAIRDLITPLAPNVMRAFNNFTLGSVSFASDELRYIKSRDENDLPKNRRRAADLITKTSFL